MRNKILKTRHIYFCIFFYFICNSFMASAQIRDTISCAWYSWTPYQYINNQGNLTGLDHALINHIFENAGIKVNYNEAEEKSWKKIKKRFFEE